jgi:8-oxo-dGTP pyrophosphatase MutT (NUDIX family)
MLDGAFPIRPQCGSSIQHPASSIQHLFRSFSDPGASGAARIPFVLTIDGFRAALTANDAREVPDEQGLRRAAVAAVLRRGPNDVELLFIHRAEDPRDPWSGHMAFPGGRVESGDRDPLAGAIRETREEVQLDLEVHGEYLGRLDDVRAIGRGRPMSLVITPFVFAIDGAPELVPNYEVAAIVWVPVGFLVDHSNRETMEYRRAGLDLELPCYRYQEHLIWGMTLGMVDELLSLVVY